MKILADASLPDVKDIFQPPFQLTLYQHVNEIPWLIGSQDVLLCRSTLKVTAALLAGSSVRYVATASSGNDHIDETYLNAHGMKLLDAKGSNASSVADYVLASVAFLQQSQLLTGLRAGVMGVGEVGKRVFTQLEKAGFEMSAYDPPRASSDKHFQSADFEEIMQCDLICIHANLHKTKPFASKNLLHGPKLQKLKKNTVIINASRGGIVNEKDLLAVGSHLIYCTDVFINEPNINPAVVACATLCTPHIAGHSIEAKQRSVIQVAEALYAAAQIPFPEKLRVRLTTVPFVLSDNWRENVLSLYNPWSETQALKQAVDKKQAFLQLRQAHQFRHDF